MSQKRVTYYECDKCGKDVGRKRDLRRFVVHVSTSGRSNGMVSFDLCQPCEAGFVAALAEYVPDSQNPNDLGRDVA